MRTVIVSLFTLYVTAWYQENIFLTWRVLLSHSIIRVSGKREILEAWAEEEGVSVTKLLGYLLHLENYHAGERSVAALGWRIFTGENVFEKPEVSLEEATWIMEKGRISQVVWQEIRLRLLDRIKLPPVNLVRAENQLHRPTLTEYQHGVKASLSQCLSLTLTERLQY